MPYTAQHLAEAPTREDIDRLQGAAVLEFGTPWCGYCQRAQPLIEAALKDHDAIQHIKVEDGPGRPLGRSFGVKLWPTLVFLRDGKEIDRVVRPQDAAALQPGMQAIAHAPAISIGPA
ncbi:thioredoxin [Paracidovorax avenae]|uniref:thioredoxin family protein n=1 Tax=Paracidovorax avenae TaxID=80867 RepID=UPI0006B3B5C2|nr:MULTISPECIES: thioredoxin family protein [Comamonadaceae]AVS62348.1 thioredoxin [Paracidovorax avenae]AVS67293.1 thioredoxin [Paracidovorax avenae]AVS70825.1 thioredoxin [Paracidovorax avenae]AVS81430.1 thioredoxin [Paracidovorax avenae]AVS99160.1 thioredoxin [Paracidovorax avenae]